jgi:DNA-binding transcriptional ArsR family regulator
MPAQIAPDLAVTGKLFARFAEPSRLSILHTLRAGPKSVTEIVAFTGLTQSNASNHLHCLHCCGIIARAQDGRHVYYSLADRRIATMLDLAENLLAEVATGVSGCTRYGGRAL